MKSSTMCSVLLLSSLSVLLSACDDEKASNDQANNEPEVCSFIKALKSADDEVQLLSALADHAYEVEQADEENYLWSGDDYEIKATVKEGKIVGMGYFSSGDGTSVIDPILSSIQQESASGYGVDYVDGALSQLETALGKPTIQKGGNQYTIEFEEAEGYTLHFNIEPDGSIRGNYSFGDSGCEEESLFPE